MTTGTDRIAAERERQITAEGWTPAHDDGHESGDLAKAAMAYTRTAVEPDPHIPYGWPWDPRWWKPSTDPIRNLEKAGALIAAEIDRRLRARHRRDTHPDDPMTDVLECLDYRPDEPSLCRGPVEFHSIDPGREAAHPRCEKHWGERLDRREQSMERYATSDVEPAWFDAADAGEHWGEDY